MLSLIEAIDERGADVFYGSSALIDREQALRFLALEAYLGHWDGYSKPNNYRLYHDPTTGLWSFIPWGLDQAFVELMTPFSSAGIVATICIRDARCLADYVDVASTVAMEVNGLDVSELVNHAQSAIAGTMEDSERAGWSQYFVEQFLRVRHASFMSQLSCLADPADLDGDGDGFRACTQDCDDADASRHPGALELCDGVDNDCDAQIDEAEDCSAQVEVDGGVFLLVPLPAEWEVAEARCREHGGALARIDTRRQNTTLALRAIEYGPSPWFIGLNDRDVENDFVWADDKSVPAVQPWMWNQPNDFADQDCVQLHPDHEGRWNDMHCSEKRPFICRLPDR